MPAAVRAFAPGRVNLIGEHTDYNGGLALPFALTAGVTVTAERSSNGMIEAFAVDLGAHDTFPARAPDSAGGWRAFVRGAAGELAASGLELVGARLRIESDLPSGAGLSSSAALTVALCLALIGLNEAPRPDPVALARICSAVEHDWVGAQTGLLDQLASLCGAADAAILIDFRSLEVRTLPLELGDHRLVVLDSGERHSLTESGYNERRAECERACALLGISSLREATDEPAAVLPEPLRRRVAHVLGENRRVLEAVDALEHGDLEQLGRLLNDSHRSLRDDYEVSTPAVEAAVARLDAAGALGARVIGGGFGGSVLGLLPPGAVPPDGAREVRPGPGATVSDR